MLFLYAKNYNFFSKTKNYKWKLLAGVKNDKVDKLELSKVKKPLLLSCFPTARSYYIVDWRSKAQFDAGVIKACAGIVGYQCA